MIHVLRILMFHGPKFYFDELFFLQNFRPTFTIFKVFIDLWILAQHVQVLIYFLATKIDLYQLEN